MATTIQVSDTTKQLLDARKKGKTYDEVIRELIIKDAPSVYGSLKGIKWNRKTDRMKFHDE